MMAEQFKKPRIYVSKHGDVLEVHHGSFIEVYHRDENQSPINAASLKKEGYKGGGTDVRMFNDEYYRSNGFKRLA